LKKFSIYLISFLLFYPAIFSFAEVEIKMKTTTIKANTELPKIIYIVPWKETAKNTKKQQKLIIHNLYGDLFDPVVPPELAAEF